jgi:hypothetical protein
MTAFCPRCGSLSHDPYFMATAAEYEEGLCPDSWHGPQNAAQSPETAQISTNGACPGPSLALALPLPAGFAWCDSCAAARMAGHKCYRMEEP